MISNGVSGLEDKAKRIRLEVFDASIKAGKGHLGGTFSCVDLLTALYYGGILNFSPKNSADDNRDRFILSKGHACLALFAIFKDLGTISLEDYESYGKDGGLGGQLDINMPGVDFNTGSLGHAVGVASGMALACKMDKKNFRVFAMVGDAELFEGSMWEGMIFASENKLNNVVVIIDRNKLSVTAALENDSVFQNFEKKIKNFGWDYHEINGHDFKNILEISEIIKKADQPVMVLANTIKGKGVSFMENNLRWHHGVPTKEEVELARRELQS